MTEKNGACKSNIVLICIQFRRPAEWLDVYTEITDIPGLSLDIP